MSRTTRQPTGKPPWPITLIAGVEKSGKSYAAAQASASDLIGRTFWLSIGENDPDELGALPGAEFEIVDHDGTYRDILAAILWASAQKPRYANRPNLLVVDSIGRLWDLLSDMAQLEANKRAARKGRANDEAPINSDLWNIARQRWDHVMDALRAHDGPVIVTARLETQTVFNDNGDPTKDKTQKVKAQKALPSEVDAIVELPERGRAVLTGVRSLRWTDHEARFEYPDFTVDALWRRLGLAEKGATSERRHSSVDAVDKPTVEADQARAELLDLCKRLGLDPGRVAAEYERQSDGIALRDATAAAAIRAFAAEIEAAPLPYQLKSGAAA